jgi:DNA-3-methyladenine glycosylase I
LKDYKAIFDALEATLFEIGSQKVSREQIRAELEPWKLLEGRKFTDDECYRKLVHIVFYSGFRAQTVSDKIHVIDRHFPDYKTVLKYSNQELQAILRDPEMIANRLKVEACIENAKQFGRIIEKHGAFQKYVDSLPRADSGQSVIVLRDKFRRLFKFLGPRTAFHFMMDIGIPVLKPDRVVERIFKRIGLVPESLHDSDALYVALIQEGRKFARATGYSIRYIDIVFVCYGQVQAKEVGIERGICLSDGEGGPSCSVCGVKQNCDYYAHSRRAAGA